MSVASDQPQQADPSIPLRLSASAIARYRSCPREFLLADVERIGRREEPSPVLCRANAIHAALERFYRVPVDQRSTDALQELLRGAWVEHRKPQTFTSKEQEREFGLSALAMLDAYAESYDTSVEPLALEMWVRVCVHEHELYGKVDRIDAASDGGVTLIDYKTGRHPLSPEELPDDAAAVVYLLASQATLGLPVEQVRFLYLATGDEARWLVDQEDAADAAGRLEALLRQIDDDAFFDPIVGPHCRFCSVAHRCPTRRLVAGENVPF